MNLSARLGCAADLKPLLDVWQAQLKWSEKARFQIELALEELIVNTFNHGYPSVGLPVQQVFVDISLRQQAGELSITLTDQAIAFDPTAATPPDITLSAEERKIGGLGLFLAAQMMDDIAYARVGERNQVQLRKLLVD